MKTKVLNFGSLNIDHVYQVDHFALPGETISSGVHQHFCGGKGLNQTIALARAGACVYHAGAIGQDGLSLKEQLEKDGADIANLHICAGIDTGHAVIQVDKNGQNCIILYGGANQSITKDQVDETLKQFEKGNIILLQNEINKLPYIMEQAGKKGLRIFLNPSPCDEKIKSLPLELVDTFLLNEVEGEQITGEKDNIMKALKEKFPKSHIILTLGSKGAMYSYQDEEIFCQAEKVKTIDTTAAGDTFTGYYIAAISNGEKVEKALELATKAAAIAVTRQGAVPSIPYLLELNGGENEENNS